MVLGSSASDREENEIFMPSILRAKIDYGKPPSFFSDRFAFLLSVSWEISDS